MATPAPGQAGQSFFKGRRLAAARVKEISVVDNFKAGYRNREDITNLPPGVLVVGSQNVLVNTASRIQARPGYAVDGAASTVNAPVKSGFQWITRGNGPRWLRAAFLTSAGNDGKLQFRYVNAAGTAAWTDLLTSLTSTSYNFTTWWDATEQLRLALFVNGSTNIFEWNGAYDTVASVTSNTITMANNIGTSGFYSTRNKVITIRGVDYTYGGISGSTFTGVSPDPTAQGANVPVAGDLAVQKPLTFAYSSFTSGPPSTYAIDLISVLNNQVFIGSLTSPVGYMSKIASYTDFSFGAPRIPGDGATFTLDDNLVAYVPQEQDMYIAAGQDWWYDTTLVQSTSYNGSVAMVIEAFKVQLLKTNNLQAAQSQALVNKAGNNVIMVTHEPAFEKLGRVQDVILTPQTTNVSDPVKIDFDSYDFTGGSAFSWKRYLLVSVPTQGIVRIFNEFTKAWEAPLTLPVTGFYTVGSELYGHSSVTSESYHLLTGYADRVTSASSGQPILAVASFSYQNYGTRTTQKSGNELYVEGYINANTTLNCEINYELDGCMTTQTFTVDGSDRTIVCIPSDESSIGKVSLGKEKLGGDISASLTGLPPKFRVIKTFPRINFFEHQFSFYIFGTDQRYELVAFGTNSSPADDTNAYISQ